MGMNFQIFTFSHVWDYIIDSDTWDGMIKRQNNYPIKPVSYNLAYFSNLNRYEDWISLYIYFILIYELF